MQRTDMGRGSLKAHEKQNYTHTGVLKSLPDINSEEGLIRLEMLGVLDERRLPSCVLYFIHSSRCRTYCTSNQLRGPRRQGASYSSCGLVAGLKSKGQYWLLIRDCWGWVTASGLYISGMNMRFTCEYKKADKSSKIKNFIFSLLRTGSKFLA